MGIKFTVVQHCAHDVIIAKNTKCGKSVIKTIVVLFTLFPDKFQLAVNGKINGRKKSFELNFHFPFEIQNNLRRSQRVTLFGFNDEVHAMNCDIMDFLLTCVETKGDWNGIC